MMCFWDRLARDSQIYLACLPSVKNRRVSGADMEVEKEMAIFLYRKRAGKRDEDGIMQFAATFKYVEAALFLSHEPKFSERYTDVRPTATSKKSGASGGKNGLSGEKSAITLAECSPKTDSESAAVNAGKDEVEDATIDAHVISDDGASSCDVKGKCRLVGAKKRKYQEDLASDVKKSAQAMSALVTEGSKSNDLYKQSSDMFESMSNRMEDIRFLQALPHEYDYFKSVLAEIMKERKERKRKRAKIW